MGRTTKIVGFSVPPELMREIEWMARDERRTKSELFREMVRIYRRYREQREQAEERWILNLIRETQEEEAQSPMSVAEMLKEDKNLARYGARRTKALGIKLRDTNRLIHEFRKKRGS